MRENFCRNVSDTKAKFIFNWVTFLGDISVPLTVIQTVNLNNNCFVFVLFYGISTSKGHLMPAKFLK